MKKVELMRRIDDDEPIRLGDLGGDLGEMLCPCDTDGDRQTQLASHTPSNGCSDIRRRPEQVGTAGDIGESLIDRDALHQRRKVTQDGDRGIAKTLIFLEVPANEEELRTKFACLAARHAASHPKSPGLVARRQYHPAAYGDRSPTQIGVEELLDRGIEGVEVGVKDGGKGFHDGT